MRFGFELNWKKPQIETDSKGLIPKSGNAMCLISTVDRFIEAVCLI